MTSRRVVVTGASSGIGAATVRLFRDHGWDVVGVARRADRLEALAAETGADVFVADLTSQSDVDALRDYLAELGPVHALVNNAGGAFGMASVEASDADDWVRMFDINVVAVKRVTSALLPLLRSAVAADGGSADILNITSIAGHIAYEGGGGYNAAKFAAHALTAVLRLELAGEPIRIVEIAPGMVKTDEFSLVRFAGDQSKADAVYDNVPNPLYAEDVAAAIVHAAELPFYVNLDLVTIKPVAQAAPHKVIRGELSPKV
ncbi:SDR family NAD(P)-dependent oxidoreductase [Glaciihabitans arcticus]|uniref:SDR family NAD(P)-dependent oxidoreductase n=1 Tax=Glaciihabitans arcticus TaxID=2668039 RepID=A0A4Q9GUM1_9MICO|nr:SDR family NAD(P)-dependent oxidoreductase [Glaciihabitans arcticus]TBN56263.1 SDR family NAD(P)-dependent oxidoreductase [Glaciihabitans arcticus]